MIKEMLKTAGVENMEDFYKLHPTEEHFFKTYPHMKNKMKKKIRRPKYQPGGTTVPFTDFAAAQTEGDQYAVDQANQQAAQQYLYSHPVYPTVTGAAPNATLPQVTITAPQKPFYYTSPKEVYQDFYQNVAPHYPMRSIADYQQSYAVTGAPPNYGSDYDADKALHNVVTGKRTSAEGLYNAYQNYLNTIAFNHAHDHRYRDGSSQADYDIATGAKMFNPSMRPYVGNAGVEYGNSTIDWNKVQQGLDTKNYNVDARKMPNFYSHDSGITDRYYDANSDYREELERIAPSEFGEVPGAPRSLFGYYAKGGIHINPAKKGTFTAQATRMGMGVQEAAKHILANKSKYSPEMVKKANFARNAAKWKHEDGGYTGMYQEGGEAMAQEQMEGAPEQAQEQAMGQEQQAGGQDQMMQQLAQMVAQGLQQGMNPQQIVQMLVQQGIPQQVASQVVQMVAQQMGGGQQGAPGQQYQSQGAQYQGPQPQAAYGGYADDAFFNQSYLPFDYQ